MSLPTQIPVYLWFLTKSKKTNVKKGYRDRTGETLFIDARQMGQMASRTHKEFCNDDLAKIAGTYHTWRGEEKDGGYEDVAGYSKSASLDDIKKNDYVLTPGRYVGVAEIEDDGIPFEVKMKALSDTLYQQVREAETLDNAIKDNLKLLGFGETNYD